MKELLQLLKQNARLSNAELAAMLGRDEATVTKQIAELEESFLREPDARQHRTVLCSIRRGHHAG